MTSIQTGQQRLPLRVSEKFVNQDPTPGAPADVVVSDTFVAEGDRYFAERERLDAPGQGFIRRKELDPEAVLKAYGNVVLEDARSGFALQRGLSAPVAVGDVVVDFLGTDGLTKQPCVTTRWMAAAADVSPGATAIRALAQLAR